MTGQPPKKRGMRLTPVQKAAAWMVAAILYLLWPLDVVPDFLVLVGWVDDLLLTGLAVYFMLDALRRPPKDGSGRMKGTPPDDVIDVEAEKNDEER